MGLPGLELDEQVSRKQGLPRPQRRPDERGGKRKEREEGDDPPDWW
jgi:hypothetical protein